MSEISSISPVVVPPVLSAVEKYVADEKAKIAAEASTFTGSLTIVFKAYWLPAVSLLVGFIAGKIL